MVVVVVVGSGGVCISRDMYGAYHLCGPVGQIRSSLSLLRNQQAVPP